MMSLGTESALLDTEFLAKYTHRDANLEGEVLHMFIDQSALYVKRLQSPETARDWAEAAHSLKGSARGIGAFKVGSRAAQLEKIAEPLKASVRMAILVLLKKDLDETKIAILRHLDNQAPTALI